MPQKSHESLTQYHERVHADASGFYSGVMPLSSQDRDHLSLTVENVYGKKVHFTIAVLDAAMAGDASARAAVDAEFLRSESGETEG